MSKLPTVLKHLPAAALLALGGGIAAIFLSLGRQENLETRVPEFIALSLAAGALYLVAVWLVERFTFSRAEVTLLLAGAALFRLLVLPSTPALSLDVFRYQWEGRVQRAGINPYTAHPEALRHLALENSRRPLDVGRATPTLYPPLSEWSFSWVKTLPGYKRLYTGLDGASMLLLLVLLAVRKQPLARVLIYAWNPAVVVAFALCSHHDSLAILALLAANLFFIIRQGRVLSIFFLALSFLSKFFALLLLPVFLSRGSQPERRIALLSEANDLGSSPSPRNRVAHRLAGGSRWAYGALFAAVVVAGYLPYADAGRKLFDGLGQYAAGWENNDSLFRLFLLAGNTKPQAGLIAAVLLAALLLHVLKRRLEPLHASLILLTGLLLLSPNAFPWYFTWTIPFLCFYPNAPWLLMSATCVLGYAPVVEYAAGQPYQDSSLILLLEYAPVFMWLVVRGLQRISSRKIGCSGSEAGL
jgi:hypothetical protein